MDDETISSGVLVLPSGMKFDEELIKHMTMPIILSADPASMGCITYGSTRAYQGSPRWKVCAP